jgi:hypothetical protein
MVPVLGGQAQVDNVEGDKHQHTSSTTALCWETVVSMPLQADSDTVCMGEVGTRLPLRHPSKNDNESLDMENAASPQHEVHDDDSFGSEYLSVVEDDENGGDYSDHEVVP